MPKSIGGMVLTVLIGGCAIGAGAWMAEQMNNAEAEAANWRWEHVIRPAMETCRNRGGIANMDGWGKVTCDR